jgi:hypothetical protein
VFENRRRLLRCSNPQSLAGPAKLEQGLASITEKVRKVAALGKTVSILSTPPRMPPETALGRGEETKRDSETSDGWGSESRSA